MIYSPKYFKESLPDWKKKKDSLLVRYIHRPLSFFASSFFCKINLTANKVSIISIVLAILASGCYLFRTKAWYIVGSILLNLWMVLDCADGNIARSVKSELFGDFIDAVSSYTLIGILFICLGVAAYHCNGLFFQKDCFWLLFAGAIASCSDSLARLCYQKYINQESFHKQEGHLQAKESSNNMGKLRKIQDRIDKEVGLNGILLPLILICSVFEWFDLLIILYSMYYLITWIMTLLFLIKITIKENTGIKS